ncbi:sce7726 family protein [Undibacterium amnicola]|uniref:Sce7726 family protein n=1 Tax=Undibacterium amnicola TaxID=1834038 RepID=A0ABR6XVH1_9BURK|nr:sce7726 family protein [Undibacterium amnicola]MBC3833475.1 sce7726 family protein [Undibacterium amnicola]
MKHFAKNHNSLSASQLAAAAGIFSSKVIQEMARTGKSETFSRLATQSGMIDLISRSTPISHFFDQVFNVLQRSDYRHEYSYKNLIANKQLLGIHSLKTASMLSEFRIGTSKADLVILNGTSTVYEIKSERDNLRRLETQISAYRKVFARVNVITGINHIESLNKILPDDVGILLLNNRSNISVVRKSAELPERTDPVSILDSVTRNEAFAILNHLNIALPTAPNTQIYSVLRRIFTNCDPAETHEAMVAVLKETRTLIPLTDLLDQIPTSLKAAILSTPIKKQDHERLIGAINTPKKEALLWT